MFLGGAFRWCAVDKMFIEVSPLQETLSEKFLVVYLWRTENTKQ